MAIPLVDLQAQYRDIAPEVDRAVQTVISSARFIGGKEVSLFEAEFAAFCQAQYCVGVSSGTAALALALEACDIGPGDEVITSTHTFVATAEAIAQRGAKPVLVDVDPNTSTIDVTQAHKAINGRTKAILPVHLYGHPADLDPLHTLCQKYGLTLINDAAQAHGALYKGQRIGSIGQVTCFSFYPGKNLGAYGDAGAIVTNNLQIAERARMLADHGRAPGSKYEHALIGYNLRLDALQAAVLRVKLPHLDTWNQKRRELAGIYNAAFADSTVGTFTPAEWATPVFHLYVVRVPAEQRAAIQAVLAKQGIATGIHYPIPVHLQPAFAYLGYKKGSLPVAEELANGILSLPLYPELDAVQVKNIASVLLAAIQKG